MSSIMQLGSSEHKELFCRFFLETHKPFRPEELPWPDLNQSTIEKLAGFPIWDYAIHAERQGCNKLTAYSNEEQDALLKRPLSYKLTKKVVMLIFSSVFLIATIFHLIKFPINLYHIIWSDAL